jgi:hypothetical protein
MKKLVTALIATAIISSPCFAKGDAEGLLTVCGYSDYFHLSSTSITNIHITKLTGDEKVEVAYKVVSNQKDVEDKTSFYVSDTPQCVPNGGYAQAHYEIDKADYCDVSVHDAENMFHPEVTARCAGTMGFGGATYDGVNTHSYSLTFTG